MILNVSNKQTFTQNSVYYNLTDLPIPGPSPLISTIALVYRMLWLYVLFYATE